MKKHPRGIYIFSDKRHLKIHGRESVIQQEKRGLNNRELIQRCIWRCMPGFIWHCILNIYEFEHWFLIRYIIISIAVHLQIMHGITDIVPDEEDSDSSDNCDK
jgi:hypothetical protein